MHPLGAGRSPTDELGKKRRMTQFILRPPFKGKRPVETTPLFRAPFFNVTGSSVCLGSSSLEKPQNPTFLSLLEYWEKRFWLTEFSHLGGNVNPTVSNLVIVTENIRNNPFDMNELKPMNKKLKDILP